MTQWTIMLAVKAGGLKCKPPAPTFPVRSCNSSIVGQRQLVPVQTVSCRVSKTASKYKLERDKGRYLASSSLCMWIQGTHPHTCVHTLYIEEKIGWALQKMRNIYTWWSKVVT